MSVKYTSLSNIISKLAGYTEEIVSPLVYELVCGGVPELIKYASEYASSEIAGALLPKGTPKAIKYIFSEIVYKLMSSGTHALAPVVKNNIVELYKTLPHTMVSVKSNIVKLPLNSHDHETIEFAGPLVDHAHFEYLQDWS